MSNAHPESNWRYESAWAESRVFAFIHAKPWGPCEINRKTSGNRSHTHTVDRHHSIRIYQLNCFSSIFFGFCFISKFERIERVSVCVQKFLRFNQPSPSSRVDMSKSKWKNKKISISDVIVECMPALARSRSMADRVVNPIRTGSIHNWIRNIHVNVCHKDRHTHARREICDYIFGVQSIRVYFHY